MINYTCRLHEDDRMFAAEGLQPAWRAEIRCRGRLHTVLAALVFSIVLLSACAQSPHAANAADNIALNRPVEIDKTPDFGEGPAATKLTDGIYGGGAYTPKETTVGWNYKAPVTIIIDLGAVLPIGGASFSTFANPPSLRWPRSIAISVSDDHKSWKHVGDLVSLSNIEEGAPPNKAESNFRFATHTLHAEGRYIAFTIANVPYIYCDEIEVYRGTSGEAPAREHATSEDLQTLALHNAIIGRINRDAAAVGAAVDACHLSKRARQAMLKKLDGIRAAAVLEPVPDPVTFKAILPLNNEDERIFAVYGQVLHTYKLPTFYAWKQHRFDYLPLMTPTARPADMAPTLSIDMLRDEYRADAVCLTNTTTGAIRANVEIDGMPDSPRPSWLWVAPVEWNDTEQYSPVADALPDATYEGGHYVIAIPAGMTRKLWFGVNSAELAPGDYHGTVRISGGPTELSIPLRVHVSAVKMNKPRLSLGMWDYSNAADGVRGITPQNREECLRLMESHFVTVPWTQRDVIPWIGQLEPTTSIQPVQFDKFNAWVRHWPHAKFYMIALGVKSLKTDYTGELGSPQFEANVAACMSALIKDIQAQNWDPRNFGVEIADEPISEQDNALIVAWEHAIKAAAPQLHIFENPIFAHPEQVADQQAFEMADILCPQLIQYHTGGAAVEEYYQKLRAAGHTLWFYDCTGTPRLQDPTRFNRLEAWDAFRAGATGINFWSFCDTGGAKSSWNEYLAPNISYTPVFLAPDSVVTSIHWEAVREGVEDYECFAMLRDAIATSRDVALQQQARELLATASDAVIGTYTPNALWQNAANGDQADVYRLQALRLLERMSG